MDNKQLKQQLKVCLQSFLERLSEEDALYEDLDWLVENLRDQTECGTGLSEGYGTDQFYSDGV